MAKNKTVGKFNSWPRRGNYISAEFDPNKLKYATKLDVVVKGTDKFYRACRLIVEKCPHFHVKDLAFECITKAGRSKSYERISARIILNALSKEEWSSEGSHIAKLDLYEIADGVHK